MATFQNHPILAYSTVATAPSPATSGTSVVLQTGDGTDFGTGPYQVLIWPTGVDPTLANAEIATCSSRSTDTLTIVRAQEGTTARSVVVGDQIAVTITAKTITDIETAIPDDTLWWAMPMEDLARYEMDGTGGTASVGGTGLGFGNASGAGNFKRLRFRFTGTHMNLSSSNLVLNTIHNAYTDGGSTNTWHGFVGLGNPTVSGTTGITWTTDHAGWKYIRESSASSLVASVADGTTNTTGSAISGGGDSTNYWHRIIKTGTTSVTFERNGSLISTLAANVMNTDAQYKATFAVSNVNTGGTFSMEVAAGALGLIL